MLSILEQDLLWREEPWFWGPLSVALSPTDAVAGLGRLVLPTRAQVLRDSKLPRSGIRNFRTIHTSQRHLFLLCEIIAVVKPVKPDPQTHCKR